MDPRVVFRTHYQVDEPAYMELLIRICTSPVRSSYREVVAQRLAGEISHRRKKSFNEDAAAYAVDLGKDLEVINENLTWTEKGHLIDLIGETPDIDWEEQLRLSLSEKLLHFRLFLEGDGAALMFLSRRLLETGVLDNSETSWNSLASEMFSEIFSNYLAITNNTQDRVTLRRKIQQQEAKYAGHSGSHKLFIHLQTLYRLGLIDRPSPGGSRVYKIPSRLPQVKLGLEILIEEIRDVFQLEKVIRNHQWTEVAAKVFQIQSLDVTEEELDIATLVSFYKRVIGTGVPLCPLSTLINASQIELLSQHVGLLRYETAMKSIQRFQKTHPKSVRFHVDRRGQPAFLKLSNDFLTNFSEDKVLA